MGIGRIFMVFDLQVHHALRILVGMSTGVFLPSSFTSRPANNKRCQVSSRKCVSIGFGKQWILLLTWMSPEVSKWVSKCFDRFRK